MKSSNSNRVNRRKISQIPRTSVSEIEELISELEIFCRSIPEQNDSSQQFMKNYVIVRLTSIIEQLMKSLISELIDELDISPELVLDDETISFELDVLNSLNSSEITKGKIIVAHLGNLDAGTISKILSKINQMDIFQWMDEFYDITENESTLKSFSELNSIFMLRNDIVYNLFNTDETTKSLIAKIRTVRIWTFAIYYYTKMNVLIFDKNVSDKDIEKKFKPIFEDDNFSNFLSKFKSLVKEHRKNFSIN